VTVLLIYAVANHVFEKTAPSFLHPPLPVTDEAGSTTKAPPRSAVDWSAGVVP